MTCETLPEPPVPADLDLRHFDCMHLDVVKLLNSDLIEECSGDEVKAALLLWARSWHQVPASSLPNDERKLAKWAGLGGDMRRWKAVRSGALRGYTLATDGRYYHHVIADKAMEAFSKSRAGKRGAKARWSNDKALKQNNTGDATAHSTTHSTNDGTLYSSGDGRPDGSGHAVAMQRREGKTLPPLPPLPPAGSASGPSAHAARPSTTTAPADDRVEVDVGNGVIFAINPFGICDHIRGPRGAKAPTLTPKQAIALRVKALNGHAEPKTSPPAKPLPDDDPDPRGPMPEFLRREPTPQTA